MIYKLNHRTVSTYSIEINGLKYKASELVKMINNLKEQLVDIEDQIDALSTLIRLSKKYGDN